MLMPARVEKEVIFPARVGMNPASPPLNLTGGYFPRASGDEPLRSVVSLWWS